MKGNPVNAGISNWFNPFLLFPNLYDPQNSVWVPGNLWEANVPERDGEMKFRSGVSYPWPFCWLQRFESSPILGHQLCRDPVTPMESLSSDIVNKCLTRLWAQELRRGFASPTLKEMRQMANLSRDFSRLWSAHLRISSPLVGYMSVRKYVCISMK